MYDFYKNVYMGSRIPEQAYPEFYQRAKDAMERLTQFYTVEGGEDAKAMALCAMAECIYDSTGKRGGVTAASVGSVSVSYGSTDRRLYDCAAVYLDIRRGVSA